MTENKKQHYVPKFYFRNFLDGKEKINIYKNDSNSFLFNVPFQTQCQEKNFYSENKEIEKAFGLIETKLSKFLKKIIENKKILIESEEDLINFYIFITLQFTRTKKKKKEIEEIVEFFSENVIKEMMISQGVATKEELDKVKITHPSMHLIKIQQALNSFPLISDLRIVLLNNETKIDFIFSDHPIIFHNSFLNFKSLGSKGLQSKGLQIFCPINKNLMICLFDTDVYDFNSKNEIYNLVSKDVLEINTLQYLYSYKVIYFVEEKQKNYIKKICSGNKNKRVSSYMDFHKAENIDKTSELLHFHTSNIDYNLNLSFLKIKESIKPDPNDRYRNIELIKEHKRNQKELEKEFLEKDN